MPAKTIKVDSAAEAYLTLLKDREVDYLFGNAGTDFPSIIEGLSKSLTGEGSAPTPITVPHENLGVAMAHGYYVATGRLASVMVHVNVGTANAICGVMNAARENVPSTRMGVALVSPWGLRGRPRWKKTGSRPICDDPR